MHEAVNAILKMMMPDAAKNRALDSLAKDIETAKGYISGKMRYCPDCNDFYLAQSFITETETKDGEVCIYRDPINSSGNEYAPGRIISTYRICPKGHKDLLGVKEIKND